jgi:hypothetical protein
MSIPPFRADHVGSLLRRRIDETSRHVDITDSPSARNAVSSARWPETP